MFAGHTHPITGMSMLRALMLLPLLCPNEDIDAGDEDIGTMLVSSCKDGPICVWVGTPLRHKFIRNRIHMKRDKTIKIEHMAEFQNAQPCGGLS